MRILSPARLRTRSADDELPTRPTTDTQVTRKIYAAKEAARKVVLYVIDGGGHTWPGATPVRFLGKSTAQISANDLIWEFFRKHPMK